MSRAHLALAACLAIAACDNRASSNALGGASQRAPAKGKAALGDFSYGAEGVDETVSAPSTAGALAGMEATDGSGALRHKDRPAARAPGAPEAGPAKEDEQRAAAPRAWFPETFLFDPLVVTDEGGRAQVAAKVPDRLTTWRVLALAHSREGGQAGALTTFRGTLPAYVDPVTPPFLVAGDRIRLPVQVVNTTATEIAEPLSIEVRGARAVSQIAAVKVPAGGSSLRYVELQADKPGLAVLRVALGATDAVVRSFPIHPSGRPVEIRRGGTLAAPRTLELEAPVDLDPDGSRLRLQVYPGALAILRSELTAASERGGAAEDAYALLLAGRAPELLTSLGETPDLESIRGVALVAGQRVVRHGRAPSLETAMLLAAAALAHPDNPVLARLGERLAQNVANGQRPDGTFSGGDGWTLQRLMVATAEGLGAVRAAQGTATARARAAAATVKASGAFERNLGRFSDGYTAAAVAASGAVSGPVLEKLRAKVRESVKVEADGSRILPVEGGAVRADGAAPTVAEATALAALALEGDPAATWRGDLGASLLSSYDPASGWGDGRTNLAAIQAVLSLFKQPIPPSTRIILSLDDKPLAEGVLDAARLKEVLVLEASAAGAAGRHKVSIAAEPPLPGLGFSLTLRAFVPWKEDPGPQGLQLSVQVPSHMNAGQAVEIALSAAAPAGAPIRVRHALPAGVQPDRASLAALQADAGFQSVRVESGAVVFEVGPRSPGQAFSARYRAVPTFAGLLHSGPSSVEILGRGDKVHFAPPSTWDVR